MTVDKKALQCDAKPSYRQPKSVIIQPRSTTVMLAGFVRVIGNSGDTLLNYCQPGGGLKKQTTGRLPQGREKSPFSP